MSVYDPNLISMERIQQVADRLADYLPPGRAFASRKVAGTITRGLIQGLALEHARIEDYINLFRQEQIPDLTTCYLDEWEASLGIPDDCFKGVSDDAGRRRDILTKLSSLGVQTSADFEALALAYDNTEIRAQAGNMDSGDPLFHGLSIGGGDFADIKEARFTLVISFVATQAEGFLAADSGWKFKALDAPAWTTDGLRFSDNRVTVLECLFAKLKPANVLLQFLYLGA